MDVQSIIQSAINEATSKIIVENNTLKLKLREIEENYAAYIKKSNDRIITLQGDCNKLSKGYEEVTLALNNEKNKNDTLTNEYNNLTKYNGELLDTIANLRGLTNGLNEENDVLRKYNAELENNLEGARLQCKSLKDEINNLDNYESDLKEDYDKLFESYNTLEKTNDKLKEELEKMEKTMKLAVDTLNDMKECSPELTIIRLLSKFDKSKMLPEILANRIASFHTDSASLEETMKHPEADEINKLYVARYNYSLHNNVECALKANGYKPYIIYKK